MTIEKTGLLTLVAVLALGLSASPIFQNYVAYAQTDDDPSTNLDEMNYDEKKCWRTDDGSVRCEVKDRRCVESDDGTLRCEGYDGKCFKTADGAIHCEKRDMKSDMKMHLDKYCEMTDEERDEMLSKYDDMKDIHERMVEYCNMSEEDREEYRGKYQDMMMDYKDRQGDMMMKDRQGDMMMDKARIDGGPAFDKRQALIDKYRELHGDLTDEEKRQLQDRLKSKYTEHYKMSIKAKYDSLSDQVRVELQNRYEEMKAYKNELRSKYDVMTDLEKEELKDNFLAKAKEKRLAWISPLKQMIAGIDVDQIECREGFNLVIKNSNGVGLCLKSSTAEKLIERGIVVPLI